MCGSEVMFSIKIAYPLVYLSQIDGRYWTIELTVPEGFRMVQDLLEGFGMVQDQQEGFRIF